MHAANTKTGRRLIHSAGLYYQRYVSLLAKEMRRWLFDYRLLALEVSSSLKAAMYASAMAFICEMNVRKPDLDLICSVQTI